MKLTEEQKVILEELISGSTNQQIADKIGYSESSIKRKVKELFNVFNVKNRASLISGAAIAKIQNLF